MMSSLHLPNFSQYSRSSQQWSLVHYSNIVFCLYLFNQRIKFFDETSNGFSHYSFFPTPTSAVSAILMILPFCYFFSIKIKSGLLASITLSRLMLTSHSSFTSSFFSAPFGYVLTNFLCVLTHFSCKDPKGLSLLHCRVLLHCLWIIFSHPLIKYCNI